jgi:hypothetical protein
MRLVFGSEQPVDLTLEKRDTKGSSPPTFVPSVLQRRFTIGVPQVLGLTPESLKDDPEAAKFIEAVSTVTFDLVALSCTFYPSKNESFHEAWLGVQLQSEGNRSSVPIAWSMKPLHDSDLVEESGTIKLEAGLKFFNSVEPKLGVEFGDKAQRHENFLTAFGLQQSQPYWYFQKTSQRELEGSYRLALVIRRNKSVKASGTISAKATVRKSAALIFTYKTSVEPASPLSFALR